MFCEFASCHKIVVSPKIVLRSSVNLGLEVDDFHNLISSLSPKIHFG